jgi:hypothetical protein
MDRAFVRRELAGSKRSVLQRWQAGANTHHRVEVNLASHQPLAFS